MAPRDRIKNDPKAVWSYSDIPTGPEDGKRGRGANPKLAWFGSCFHKNPGSQGRGGYHHLNWIYAMLEASPIGKHMMFEGYDYAVDKRRRGQGRLASPLTGRRAAPAILPGSTRIWPRRRTRAGPARQERPQIAQPVGKMRLSDPTGCRAVRHTSVSPILGVDGDRRIHGPATKTQTEKGAFLTKLERESIHPDHHRTKSR